MSQFSGVERPGPWETIGDHERRVRALEATPCCFNSSLVVPLFTEVMFELATAFDLLGYWRLGEPSGDFADTSGHAGGASDMGVETGTTPITRDVTGALLAAQDDGAVRFNVANNASGEFLEATQKARWDLEGQPLSITGFVRPTASASTFYGHAFGRFNAFSAGAFARPGGYGFLMSWPTREIQFRRAHGLEAGTDWIITTGGVLVADEWAFVAGTFSGNAQDGGRHRLYLNGVLVDEVLDATVTCNSTESPPTIGRTNVAASTYDDAVEPGTFYGSTDEVAIWGDELTEEAIEALYEAATTTGSASSGQVPIADGNGGWDWGYPTIEVYENGS